MGDRVVVDCRVLGPVEVLVGGAPRALGGPRQRMLLAALVLADGNEVASDQLCELLWGVQQPLHPQAALRSQVARLRRNIGEDLVDVRYGVAGYELSVPRGCVDAARFDSLARSAAAATGAAALASITEALELWRGDDLEFSDRPLLQPTAVRLVERRLSLIEGRADLLLAVEQVPDAIAELRALLAAHPERESARALLMEALYRQGRHTEALAEFRWWRQQLRDRGLEPTQRLRDMETRILRHEVPGSVTVSTHRADARPSRRASSSFVGRDVDVEETIRRLRNTRLVTLTGPGGVGKTRLAEEVAARIGDAYPGGVEQCDLSAIRERNDVVRLVAAMVGAKDVAGTTIVEQIVDRLVGRGRCLVVMDNCEHVLAAASTLVARLLDAIPGITVLATSQGRLGVDGEHVWPLHPLATGDIDSPAIRLFLDRAASVAPHLRTTDIQLQRIRRICERVDGLPLGIEIAAAQTSALSLDDLDQELGRWVELAAPGAAPDGRHRSLRSMVDWSYQRLDDLDRRVLERLSCFVGVFDLDAARALLDDLVAADQVAPPVIRLVSGSLLSFEDQGETSGYRMLETVRSYCCEQLRARDELAAAQARHARWAIDVAETAGSDMSRHEQIAIRRLNQHFDDLRAAHHWLVAFDPDGALALVHALHPYAFHHGRTEVFRWAEIAAALGSTSPLRSSVAASVCAGAWLRGDLHAAERAAQAAISATPDPTDPLARRVLEQLGELALLKGDARRAVDMYDRAHHLSTAAGDELQATWDLGSSALALLYVGHVHQAKRRATATLDAASRCNSPSVQSFAHFVAGEVAANIDDRERARAHLERSVEIARVVGNEFIASLAEVTLASLTTDQPEALRATIAHYRAAITNWQRLGMWTPLWVTMRNLVGLLVSVQAFEHAAVLYGAVVAAATTATPIYGQDQARLQTIHTKLKDELGAARLTELTQRARAFTPDRIVSDTLELLTHLTT